MKITVTNTEEQGAENPVLAVAYEVTNGDVVVYESVQAFPLDTTEEKVRAFLERTLRVVSDDITRSADASVLRAAHDNATKVSKKLKGASIDN